MRNLRDGRVLTFGDADVDLAATHLTLIEVAADLLPWLNAPSRFNGPPDLGSSSHWLLCLEPKDSVNPSDLHVPWGRYAPCAHGPDYLWWRSLRSANCATDRSQCSFASAAIVDDESPSLASACFNRL
jgi:hypothetical protein